METMYDEKRYVKDRRVHVERGLSPPPKGYLNPERRKNDRRSDLDRRLTPWSWNYISPLEQDNHLI